VLFAEEILSCFFGQYTAHCSFPPLHSFNYFLLQKNSPGLQHYPTACVVRRRNLRFPLVQIFLHSYNKGIHLVYSTIPRPVLFAEEILSCLCNIQHIAGSRRCTDLFIFCTKRIHLAYSTIPRPVLFMEEILDSRRCSFFSLRETKEFISFTAISHGRCCLQKKS